MSVRGKTLVSVSRNSRYRNLLDFAAETLDGDDMEAFAEAMVFDYYMRDNVKTRPGFFRCGNAWRNRFPKEFYQQGSAGAQIPVGAGATILMIRGF